MSVAAETLPDLNAPHALPPGKHEEFVEKGHTVVRNLATPEEAKAYLPHIGEALERNKKEDSPYAKAFIQVGNLWELSEKVRRFTYSRRFARVAAELMGVDGVRVYADQGLFKEAGGGATAWHQDQYYWPIDTKKTITMWMPLTKCPIEMGTLVFASGLYQKGPLAQLEISDAAADYFGDLGRREEWDLQTYELDIGDATFHAGWTPHKAPGNITDRMRPVMTIIFMAHDARLIEPMNEHQPADLARWFPGRKPGDLAASRLNPILWHKDESLIGSHEG